MGRYSVKRYKTKRRTRDLDLIYYQDMGLKESINRLKHQPIDENKPGLGQYYCIECAHYFENQLALDRHNKGKKHKRRVRELKQQPYSNLEAEAANGINMAKFVESVQKYKNIEADKAAQGEEIEAMLREKKGTIEEIMGFNTPQEGQEEAATMED